MVASGNNLEIDNDEMAHARGDGNEWQFYQAV